MDDWFNWFGVPNAAGATNAELKPKRDAYLDTPSRDLTNYIPEDDLRAYRAVEDHTRSRLKQMGPPELGWGEKLGGALQSIGGAVGYAQGNPQFGQFALKNNILADHQDQSAKFKDRMSAAEIGLINQSGENMSRYISDTITSRRKRKEEAEKIIMAFRAVGRQPPPELLKAAGMPVTTGAGGGTGAGPISQPVPQQQLPSVPGTQDASVRPQGGPPPMPQGAPGISVGEAPAGMPPQAPQMPQMPQALPPATPPAAPGPQAGAGPNLQLSPEAKEAGDLSEVFALMGNEGAAGVYKDRYGHLSEGTRAAQRADAETRAKIKARHDQVVAQGLDPKSDPWQSFILSGEMNTKHGRMSVGTEEAVRTSDEAVRQGADVGRLIDDALELSKTAYDGWFAGQRALLMANLTGDQAAQDTIHYDKIVQQKVLNGLKASFGSNPTEGERAAAADVEGMSNAPQKVREKILKKAKATWARRRKFEMAKSEAMRDGSYYQPGMAQKLNQILEEGEHNWAAMTKEDLDKLDPSELTPSELARARAREQELSGQ